MSFGSLAEFLAMGGHGLYVWLAYGATVAVFAANVLSVRLAWRRHLRRVRLRDLRGEAAPTTSSTPSSPGSVP